MRLPYFLIPSVVGCWYICWMPPIRSSFDIAMLLASTSIGLCARSALAIDMIMLVKPGPSVPEVAATSPVTREKPSAAAHMMSSMRPP